MSDLISGDRALWAKAHPKGCPGIAIGHFEQSNFLTYVVLMVPKPRPTHGFKILILKKLPSGNNYTGQVLDQSDGEYSASGLVIAKAPPGKYSDFEGTAQVQVNLDAILVEWIEKASVLYYWENGKYRKVQTSD
ncbi:MAG TPA: hypothetical protein VKH81_13610 [Candidatus Angelobacter sp.]|nr:hypothetical protein [Candidatus Angelobacter sp.]